MKVESLKEFVDRIYADTLKVSPFSADEHSCLNWLERMTHTQTNHAQMLVGKEEGAFLHSFTLEVAKRVAKIRILEIGTFTGYSLLCFAFAIKKAAESLNCSSEAAYDYKVDALEINDELEYLIQQALERGNVADFVNVHFCDALEYLKERELQRSEKLVAEERYDIIFIDANKREYPQYYKYALECLSDEGYILVDNVSWYGLGNSSSPKNTKTKGVAELNSIIENDTKNHLIESCLLNIRDGLYIIRKRLNLSKESL